MLLSLPLLCFGFLLLSFWRHRADREVRAAFLFAAVAWGAITVVLTEGLSLLGGLTAPNLALGWAAAAIGASLVAVRRAADQRRRLSICRPSPVAVATGLPILVILSLTGVVAVLGWPNNIDSFGYHLSRVAHWIQNRSIAFYPTHITHQLYYPPWAEYAVLQLKLLGWDERLVNLAQWFSMLGSLIGVSLIARELGAGPSGQTFAALVCATLPMGILQASTTQNDFVLAFWLVCLVYGLLAWRSRPADRGLALLIGGGLGLALLTKGSAYLFAPPLLVCLLLDRRVLRPRCWLGPALLVTLVALALNAPQYARNREVFGSLLGPARLGAAASLDDPLGFSNEAWSIPVLTSNLVRNVALHLGTPLPAANLAVERLVVAWHDWLGLAVDDSRTTWGESLRFWVPPAPASEDYAGNPIHLLAIVAAGLMLLTGRRDPRAWRYALGLLLGFGLFSLLLKWQAVHSRLHLPLFVLSAALVGLVLQARPRLLAGLAVVMLAWATPYLLQGQHHPLIGERSVFVQDRLDQTFRYNNEFRALYSGPAEFIRQRGCSQVGLVALWNGLEYLFWLLLPEVQGLGGRLEHVAVANSAARLASRWPVFQPCAVLVLHGDQETLEVGGRLYRPAWSNGRLRVFTPAGPE